MTDTIRAPAPSARSGVPLTFRAAGPGLVLGPLAATAVVLAGAAPAGAGSHVLIGAGLAAVIGAVGVGLKCRAVTRPSAIAPGQQLSVAILGDFVLQLFGVGVTLLALVALGVKFAAVAAFALAFVTVALVHQVASAWVLARALKQGAVERAVASRDTDVSPGALDRSLPSSPQVASPEGSPARR